MHDYVVLRPFHTHTLIIPIFWFPPVFIFQAVRHDSQANLADPDTASLSSAVSNNVLKIQPLAALTLDKTLTEMHYHLVWGLNIINAFKDHMQFSVMNVQCNILYFRVNLKADMKLLTLSILKEYGLYLKRMVSVRVYGPRCLSTFLCQLLEWEVVNGNGSQIYMTHFRYHQEGINWYQIWLTINLPFNL